MSDCGCRIPYISDVDHYFGTYPDVIHCDRHSEANVARLERELAEAKDDLSDFEMVINHCSRVYDYMSRGRMSTPNTLPEVVIVNHEDILTKEREEDIKEATKELEAENERLRKENKTWATAVVQRRTEIERLEAVRERLEKLILGRNPMIDSTTDDGDFCGWECFWCDGHRANQTDYHQEGCIWKELTEGE